MTLAHNSWIHDEGTHGGKISRGKDDEAISHSLVLSRSSISYCHGRHCNLSLRLELLQLIPVGGGLSDK